MNGRESSNRDRAGSRCWARGSVHRRDETGPAIGDRAFRYGDGVFCTLAIRRGRLLDASAQLTRLTASAAAIGLEVPGSVRDPAGACAVLARLGAGPGTDAVARIQVSAGTGGRGYDRGGAEPWELVELLPLPESRVLTVAVLPESESPLSPVPAVKSCSALPHVLCAAAAARRGVAEGLRTADGALVEACAANLFWADGESLFTPSTDLPLYPGATRAVVIEVARGLGWRVEEGTFGPAALRSARGAFLTNAVRGVEPVGAADGVEWPWPEELEALREAVERHRDDHGLAVTPA